jgi:hypothetical protein
MLGIQTDNTLASQVQEQHVVAVQTAAIKAASECGWVNAQQRVTVDLGAEQDTLDYPEGGTPGSIRAMSVYDGDRYIPLDPRIIPISADGDQEQIAGGATFQGIQGRPRYYEQRHQIKLAPFSDKAYKVRIDYMRPTNLPLATSVSIVDGMLIVFAAASMMCKQMENDSGATYYAGLYTDRMRTLMGWQSQGTTFAMASDADMGEDEMPGLDPVPSWDRRPTVR